MSVTEIVQALEKNLSELKAALAAQPVVAPVVAPASDVLWSHDFAKGLGSFSVQAKAPDRVSIIDTLRGKAVRLLTKPGDNNVFGSGPMERCDLALSQQLTDGYEGREAWWHHEIMLPDDFSMPTWHKYVFFDFHNTTSGPGQANFHVDTDGSGNLAFRGYGQGVQYSAVIGKPQKNHWYAFDYHVFWNSDDSGYFDAWVNGKRVLSYTGPTLYAGQGVYLKLANYHTPVCDPFPACIGTHPASAVLHANVRRGKTWQSVSLTPLEGVT